MIVDSLLKQIEVGRQGRNKGFSIGLPKLENYIDGLTKGTNTLIISGSGSGNIQNFAVYMSNHINYQWAKTVKTGMLIPW